MVDLHQSEAWADFLTSQGWIIEGLNGAKAYIRKFPFYKAAIKIQRPQTIPPIGKIDKIAKNYRALFVKLEPDVNGKKQGLGYKGFELDKTPSLPTKTLVLGLSRSKEELWRSFSSDTRHDIKAAKNYQLSSSSYKTKDKGFDRALDDFSQLQLETGRRQGIWTPNLTQLKAKFGAFKENSDLFLIHRRPHKHPLAGAVILIHGKTAYYHHTATSIEGRKLNASYLLMWEIIKRVKDLKLKNLDLESIYDARYHKATKGWQKFSVFKKKWRGHEVEYPPPLIKFYNPVIRFLFR